MNQHEIIDALKRCLSETEDDGRNGCEGCTYENDCISGGTMIVLPVRLVEEIRNLLKRLEDDGK